MIHRYKPFGERVLPHYAFFIWYKADSNTVLIARESRYFRDLRSLLVVQPKSSTNVVEEAGIIALSDSNDSTVRSTATLCMLFSKLTIERENKYVLLFTT